jgi:hypothetical protein
VAAAAAALLARGSKPDDADSSSVREAVEVTAQLARASASARARVAALRARGATLPELDGRLAAADLLARRGEPEGALKTFEEVLVLANALVESYGLDGPIDIPDPLDARIDARLSRVFDQASEAARARCDELLSSARLAEKVEEIARARIEELLSSKRLAARIEEVAQRHAENVVSHAVEALLSADAFKQAVDARARARAEEAFAAVKSGASPEAIEGAVDRVLGRRDKESSGRGEKLLDPEALERRLVPLVSSLVKASLSDEQAVQNKVRNMVAEEVNRAAAGMATDDEHVRRIIGAEIARREAMAQARETGDGLSDRATAIANSDAMKAVLDEHFKLLRAGIKKEIFDDLERIAKANRTKPPLK